RRLLKQVAIHICVLGGSWEECLYPQPIPFYIGAYVSFHFKISFFCNNTTLLYLPMRHIRQPFRIVAQKLSQ
ncbi:hypothetical protein CHS0354_005277, partial [Potamilus streckersoni]